VRTHIRLRSYTLTRSISASADRSTANWYQWNFETGSLRHGLLPAIHVDSSGRHQHYFALGQRRSLRDRHSPAPRKPPRPSASAGPSTPAQSSVGQHTNPQPNRLRTAPGPHFPMLRSHVALPQRITRRATSRSSSAIFLVCSRECVPKTHRKCRSRSHHFFFLITLMRRQASHKIVRAAAAAITYSPTRME